MKTILFCMLNFISLISSQDIDLVGADQEDIDDYPSTEEQNIWDEVDKEYRANLECLSTPD
jgi:hypothetical protein